MTTPDPTPSAPCACGHEEREHFPSYTTGNKMASAKRCHAPDCDCGWYVPKGFGELFASVPTTTLHPRPAAPAPLTDDEVLDLASPGWRENLERQEREALDAGCETGEVAAATSRSKASMAREARVKLAEAATRLTPAAPAPLEEEDESDEWSALMDYREAVEAAERYPHPDKDAERAEAGMRVLRLFDAARARAERAEAMNADLIAGRVDIHELTAKSGAFDLKLGGDGAKAVCAAFIEMFRTGGGQNYLTMTFHDPKTSELFDVTVQRVGGLTPAQKLATAEATIALLRAALEGTIRDLLPCPWERMRSEMGDNPNPNYREMVTKGCTTDAPCRNCVDRESRLRALAEGGQGGP